MKSKVIDVSKFEKLGLGSFYGVAMGAHEPAKLILVEYRVEKQKISQLLSLGKDLLLILEVFQLNHQRKWMK